VSFNIFLFLCVIPTADSGYAVDSIKLVFDLAVISRKESLLVI